MEATQKAGEVIVDLQGSCAATEALVELQDLELGLVGGGLGEVVFG